MLGYDKISPPWLSLRQRRTAANPGLVPHPLVAPGQPSWQQGQYSFSLPVWARQGDSEMKKTAKKVERKEREPKKPAATGPGGNLGKWLHPKKSEAKQARASADKTR